jgi:protein TonB
LTQKDFGSDFALPEEKLAFWRGTVLGVLMHVAVIGGILFISGPGESQFVSLATADLSIYDPLGGTGGSDSLLEEPPQEDPIPEELMEEPEPEPIPEEFAVLESTSEEAEPLPPPPPPIEKPKENPKPRVTRPAASTQTASIAPGSGGTGMGGTPGGTGRGNSDELSAYKAMVRRKMERGKKYPPAAQTRRLTGVVRVSFVINKDGAIHSVSITESSGHSLLDDEVLALLKRLAPLPPLPESSGLSSLKVVVPLRFSLT